MFNRFMKNYKKLPIDPTPTGRGMGDGGRGMGVREGGTSWLGGTLVGGGVWICWGGGVRWGGGVDVRSCSKCCFWALFGKLLHIGRPWMNVFVRVFQKVAEIRVIIYKI